MGEKLNINEEYRPCNVHLICRLQMRSQLRAKPSTLSFSLLMCYLTRSHRLRPPCTLDYCWICVRYEQILTASWRDNRWRNNKRYHDSIIYNDVNVMNTNRSLSSVRLSSSATVRGFAKADC
jgi:hypothetical protein